MHFNYHSLAISSMHLNEFSEARELLTLAVKWGKDALGENHPLLALSQYNLALVYCFLDESEKSNAFI